MLKSVDTAQNTKQSINQLLKEHCICGVGLTLTSPGLHGCSVDIERPARGHTVHVLVQGYVSQSAVIPQAGPRGWEVTLTI